VLFIWRPEPTRSVNAGHPGAESTTPVELILAKERNGPTGSACIAGGARGGTVFVEEAPQWHQEAPTRPAHEPWHN
jgi:hypothetical protein